MTMTYQIATADLQEQQVACVHGRILPGEMRAFLTAAYSRIPAATAQQGLGLEGPPYARYRFEEDGTIDVEAGFSVCAAVAPTGDVGPGTLPGGHVVTTIHVGAYDRMAGAYDALEKYLSKNGYEPAGAAWECYLDEPDVPEPRTKVYQPARRLSRRPTEMRAVPSSVASGGW
jgi:effector-binding domain-containing protein